MRHGYLIDMDGVLYRGHELIPGADRFVEQLVDGVAFERYAGQRAVAGKIQGYDVEAPRERGWFDPASSRQATPP